MGRVRVVLDIGARDCEESVAFHPYFPGAHIYAFECNPVTLPVCRKAIENKNKLHLVEKAVSEIDGSVTFYQIDKAKTTMSGIYNPGSSSLYVFSEKSPEKYAQKAIHVESVRLATSLKEEGLEHIDLLWMDVQGAELLCLKSLGGE